MSTQMRRTTMPITEAVYPRKKKRDDSTPEERLAEHLASKAVQSVSFRITGSAKATLGHLHTRMTKKRRPRRARKAVAA